MCLPSDVSNGLFTEQRAKPLRVPDTGFEVAARQQDQEFLAAVPVPPRRKAVATR